MEDGGTMIFGVDRGSDSFRGGADIYGQPAPGTMTWVESTRPVPGGTISGMRHSAATMNSVFPSWPPSMQAKHPRSTLTV
jgi:hypothetical protein